MSNKFAPEFRRDCSERGDEIIASFWSSSRRQPVPLLKSEVMRRTGMAQCDVESGIMSLLQRRLLTSDRITDGKAGFSIYDLTPQGEPLVQQMIEVAA